MQHTQHTKSRTTKTKKKREDGMIMLSHSTKDMPIMFVSAGMRVEVAMSVLDDVPCTMVEGEGRNLSSVVKTVSVLNMICVLGISQSSYQKVR